MNNNLFDVFLVCLFLLGNSVITFNSSSIFALLLFLALSGTAVLFYAKPNNFSVDIFMPNRKTALFKGVLFALLFVFCLVFWANTVKDYSVILLDGTKNAFGKTALCLAFSALCLLLALCKKSVIKMFAKASFFITAISFLIMFLSSSRSFEFSFLKDAFGLTGIAKPTLLSFLQSFGGLFICFLFLGQRDKKSAKSISGYALALGGCFYLICFFNSLFVIGPKVSAALFSPYAFSTASVFSGGEFARVDLLVYYVFFVCATVKSSVILWVILNCAKAIHPILKKAAAVVFLIIGALMGVLNTPFFSSNTFLFLMLLFEIALPILLCVFVKKSSLHQPTRHS